MQAMHEIRLGRRYQARPLFTVIADKFGGVAHQGNGSIQPKTAIGECVYIHPKGRFVTLEFQARMGVLRECFRPVDIT